MQLSLNHNETVVYHSTRRVLVVWPAVALSCICNGYGKVNKFSRIFARSRLICTEKSFRIFLSIWWTRKEMLLFIYLFENLFARLSGLHCHSSACLHFVAKDFLAFHPFTPQLDYFSLLQMIEKWVKCDRSSFYVHICWKKCFEHQRRWICNARLENGRRSARKSFVTARCSWKLSRDHRCH